MIYYAPPSTPAVRMAMSAGQLGAITTPRQGNILPDGVAWVADNGCYGRGYPGDDKWLSWLASRPDAKAQCGFATAPDVVGDAIATLARSAPHLPVIRDLGYPAALVAQDGLEDLRVPWGDFDVLFIGGSATWKLSAAARELIAEARRRRVRVHMGRVNSLRRFRYAHSLGCSSVDGTIVAFAPDRRLPEVLGWCDVIKQPSLF